MTDKQKGKNKSCMTASEILERDYASCKLARQFWSLLYGSRMKDKVLFNANK